MRAYLFHQDDLDLETDLGFHAVLIAFNVEDDSVVAQNARLWVSSFNVCWSSPIRILHLANPSAERRSNFGVPQREINQHLFSH